MPKLKKKILECFKILRKLNGYIPFLCFINYFEHGKRFVNMFALQFW